MKQKLGIVVLALFLLSINQRISSAKAELGQDKEPKSGLLSTLLNTDKNGKPRQKRACNNGGCDSCSSCDDSSSSNSNSWSDFWNNVPAAFTMLNGFGGGFGAGFGGGLGGLNNLLPLIINGADNPRIRQDPEIIVVTVPVRGRKAGHMDVTAVPDYAKPINSKYQSKITNWGVNIVPKAGGGYRTVVNRDELNRDRVEQKVGLDEECDEEIGVTCMEGMTCARVRTGLKQGKFCQCTAPLVASQNQKTCVSPYGPREK